MGSRIAFVFAVALVMWQSSFLNFSTAAPPANRKAGAAPKLKLENASAAAAAIKCDSDLVPGWERAGLGPYVIEAPDLLMIEVVRKQLAEERSENERDKPSISVPSSLNDIAGRPPVGPDGTISLGQFGLVDVNGLTVDRAKQAIEERLGAAAKDWKVNVGVCACNSKRIYVVVERGPSGDTVCQLVCTPKATVGSALKEAVWPQPMDFDSVSIVVCRHRQHVNDDLSVEGEERILPIAWDTKKNEPTTETNHQLLPGDRVFVTMPKAQCDVAAIPPTPVVPGAIYATPPILAATPRPYSADAKPIHRYSAIPAAVPSPFSNDPVDAVPHFVAVPNPVAVRATPPTFGGVTPVMAIEPEPAKPSTVRFDIAVVEDLDDSFAEFDELRTQMPFMLADSSTMRGTLRILKKYEHVRQIASPKLMAVAGERAQFSINNAIAKHKESDADFRQALAVEVSARELGGGLAVEFRLRNSNEGNVNEVATSLIVPHGQSVVMKTGTSQVTATDGDAAKSETNHAVYIVLTPELVR